MFLYVILSAPFIVAIFSYFFVFGRSYAESPDIDGRIYFTADGEVAPGTFVNVRLTGTMDGELVGEMA